MITITETFASVGIDLGDRIAHYACLDPSGAIVEEGTVEMKPESFRRQFGAMEPTVIALEAGAQSRWASQVLEELGHDVVVANARQLKLITASNRKNDVNDARLLARLARVDTSLLHPVEHRGDAQQVTLVAIRARAQLVKMRTAAMLSLRGMVKCFGVRLPRATSDRFLERCRQAVPEPLRRALDGVLDVIATLTAQIMSYDEQLEETARKQYAPVARLAEIYGIGPLTALTYVVTLGDPQRFTKSRDVGCYLGLTPSQRQSGDQDPQLRISKAGDPYLRSLLVQCAHTLLRDHAPDSALRRWGLRLCARGGKNAKKRAVVAVARKLAVLLHRLWVTGEHYRPNPGY